MPATLTIADLRRLVADRFPTATARRGGRCVETGIAAFDATLGGGLAAGALTELVSASPGCGAQLFQTALMRATRMAGLRMALLDAANAFAPEQFDNGLTAHVAWFRGSSLKLFWQAADIVVRDNNYAVAVMDLRDVPERELRRTPATVWYRIQRAVEESEIAVLVQSSAPIVPCAACRLVLPHTLTLAAFKRERTDLVAALTPELQRQRNFGRFAV